MKEYIVKLSTAQDLALSYVTVVQQDWINNAVENRCRTAIEEIVKICVDNCLAQNVSIPGTQEDIVILAFEKGWIKTAQQMHDETVDAIVANQ